MNPEKGSGGIISWNPFSLEGGENESGFNDRLPELGFFHELFGHGLQYLYGSLYPSEDIVSNANNPNEIAKWNEVDASNRENIIRSALNQPLRNFYEGKINGMPTKINSLLSTLTLFTEKLINDLVRDLVLKTLFLSLIN